MSGPENLPARFEMHHRRVDLAFIAAQVKHGDQSIAVLAQDDPRWLPILVEEVGEVAQLLTPDHGHNPGRLYAELIQVAAVALGWAEAVFTARGEPPVAGEES